jgi:hypothetical protein
MYNSVLNISCDILGCTEMSDADLVALKKAAPLIKEMLIAVDKELYARAEVRTVEGVRLVEGRNQRKLPALKSFAPFGILLSASTTRRSKL